MKIIELVAKVEKLSMQEIDELVDNGIEIEDIQYILLHDDKNMDETLFKNEKLKNFLLKRINEYVVEFFEDIKNNPTLQEKTDTIEKVVGGYFREYFKDAIELEIGNARGRKIFSIIRELVKLRNTNDIVSKLYKKNNIWGKYSNIIRKIASKDFLNMSKEDALEYNKTFGSFFSQSIIGSNIPEAEAALKITQREDIDITEAMALDMLLINYAKEKNKPNGKILSEDELFSILLDYAIQAKNKGIEKETLSFYSPIKEMEKAINEGKFGQNNSLSKEEFAFAIKTLQNPEIFDSDVNQKICEILEKTDIQFEIGKREISFLLGNKGIFNQISEKFPHLQDRILKQIDESMYSILKDISDKERKITPEEMKKYSQYFRDYFEISLDKHGDTIEISRLFNLAIDMEYPNIEYNLVKVPDETAQFCKNEGKEKEIFEKYDSKINQMVSKLQAKQTITQEEFKQYDDIFCEYAYKIVLDDSDNVNIIRTLEQRSKELQVRSKTIENEIEQYIYKCVKGKGDFKEQGFYETILKYYERQLKGPAIEINGNAAISHLIRVAQKGKIHEDIANIVLEQLEERKKKNPIPEISNPENLEEYMQNVAEIRLQQGRMPRECCEFIIKQDILKRASMNRYRGMIERALEDLTEYELEDSKISDYYIAVLNQPFLGKKNNGSQNGDYKTIKLSRQTIQLSGTFKILETILHEKTHVEQDECIKNGQLNKYTYRMLKERILSEENTGFYDDNYSYMYKEIDARRNGYMQRIQLLKRIGLTDSQIAELQKENIKETITKHLQYCKEGKVKKLGKETKNVNTMFLELLQQKPELLVQHSELKMEFEKNGDSVQRRSLAKILQSYEQMLSTACDQKEIEGISSLCAEILLEGGEIPDDKLQEELEQLMEVKSDNEIIKAYKNKLLTIKFPKQMVMELSMKSMYDNHSAQQRLELQQDLKKELKLNKEERNLIHPKVNSEGRDE